MTRRGFTLIEALLVVSLLGVMVGLLLPAVQKARASAARAACGNQLKQVGVALHAYHAAKGRLPAEPPREPADPAKLLSWAALVLPELGEDALYRRAAAACAAQIDPTAAPHDGFATPVRPLVCPADGRLRAPLTDSSGITAAYMSYVGNYAAVAADRAVSRAEPGVLGWAPGVRLDDVSDGTANTYMVGERPPPASLQAGWWYPETSFPGQSPPIRGPNNVLSLGILTVGPDPCAAGPIGDFGPGVVENPCDRHHLWSLHPGGANFLFADGHVSYLAHGAGVPILALASRAAGDGPAGY